MTITTIIRKSATARFGYEWVEIHDDGTETIVALNKKTTDNYLYLPENNPFNRRLIGMNFLAKQGDEWEVTVREKSPRTVASSTSRKGLEEYLDNDDRALYLALVEKALANKERAKNDPIAKARKALEKAQREYEALVRGEKV